MSTELLTKTQQQIKEKIIKQSCSITFKAGICAAMIMLIIFFVILPPNDIVAVITRVFSLVVLSLLVACFTYVTYSSKQFVKHGIPIKCAPMNNKHQYVSSYDSNHNTVNPATGLPMIGGVDVAGNPIGCDLRRTWMWL